MQGYRSRTRPLVAYYLLAMAGAAGLAQQAAAQQQQGPPLANPRVLVVTPNGGKVGTTVEVTLTGTDLEEPTGLLFSNAAIKAEFVPPPPPPMGDPKKPMPAPAPTPPRFKVTIPANTPLGIHDLRLIGKYGISNPRAFVVGEFDEVLEKEPNNDVDQALKLEMNSTATGAIAQPTDVDYYTFTGKKGQRVVVSCLSSSIDSRLEPVIEIYDTSNRLLAMGRAYAGLDALTDLTCPADGDYVIRLYQFTHTIVGTTDYFYRLTVTTAPWIDAAFPNFVEPGKPTQVTLYGRNLPGGTPDPTAVVDNRVLDKAVVTITAPKDPVALQRLTYSGLVAPVGAGMDGFEYRVKNPSGSSNPVLIGYARAPIVLDGNNNDRAESAQAITVPCEIAGRIEKRRDRDWYSFTAKQGEVYSIEVFSERVGSLTDMQLTVRNAATKQNLTELDDNAETLTPFKFYTRTGDPPRYRFQAPADGTYELLILSQDADTIAGPRQWYRVSILPEKPDFRVILMPEDSKNPNTCIVEQGGTQMLDVFIWPLDGWTAPVTLTMEGLPPGVTSPPVIVGPGVRIAAMVVQAAASAAPWAGEIRVKGTATVDGQKIEREARPASITWAVNPQQNIVTISRLDRTAVLAVRPNPAFTMVPEKLTATIIQGDKATINFKLNRLWPDFKTPLQVNAVGLATGLTFNNAQNQPITLNPGNDNGQAVFNAAANVMPGTYTVVLRGQAQIPFSKDPMAKQKPNVNVVQASPPIVLSVLPKTLATVSLANANPAVKVGMEGELIVKVARQYNYAGEYKVEIVLPNNTTGLTIAPATIPAGKDEIKLAIKCDDKAAPGARQNLTAKVTAMYNPSTPVVHEIKFNVNVTK